MRLKTRPDGDKRGEAISSRRYVVVLWKSYHRIRRVQRFQVR
jgi:hypothetical protein